MALGWGHALVCTADGELYSWGYSADGRLGFKPDAQRPDQGGDSEVKGASEISESRTRIQNAEAVVKHVDVMMQREKAVVPRWEPYRVEALAKERVTQVASGMDHSLALAGMCYHFFSLHLALNCY
jgi:alpha-tubulin suppressor-like RCC1 family protein